MRTFRTWINNDYKYYEEYLVAGAFGRLVAFEVRFPVLAEAKTPPENEQKGNCSKVIANTLFEDDVWN